MRVNARGLARAFIWDPPDIDEILFKDIVRRSFDPSRYIDIRRSAVGGIVFEAAFVRRIVRRADDNAVRKSGLAVSIAGQDCVRDYRRRRVSAMPVDHRLNAVGGQHFERTNEGRLRQRVRVHAEEKRTVYFGLFSIEANGLADCQNMRLVETARRMPSRGVPKYRKIRAATRSKGRALARNKKSQVAAH